MAESASSMKQFLCSDWLPERARSAYLARPGFPASVPQEKVHFSVIRFLRNETVLFWIQCELFTQWGASIQSEERS